jgi:iron only hydrogenase large subunit-like protein
MSSSVFLSNVDDYLAPSQACVNPLFSTDKAGKEEKKENDSSTSPSPSAAAAVVAVVPRQRHRRKRVNVALASASSASSATVKPPTIPLDPVKASIADCLACSGCVTTAETVLVEQQHSLILLREMIARPAADRPDIVVTVSPASWADLLRHVGIDVATASTDGNDDSSSSRLLGYQRKLTTLLHRTLCVSVVLDGNLPLQWSLKQATDEFCRAHGRKHKHAATATDTSTSTDMHVDAVEMMSEQERLQQQLTPSMALSSSQTVYMQPDGTTVTLSSSNLNMHMHRQQQALPLIASSCPAVVCLLEKSVHAAVPHLSTTKSPMSAAGTYWKHQQQQHDSTTTSMANPTTTPPTPSTANACFHLAIMPCHDKKLEASRKDFQQGQDATDTDESPPIVKDVDMVVTTQECFQLLQELVGAMIAEDAMDTSTGSGSGSGIVSSSDSTTPASIAMVRDYLESMPMAPILEHVSQIQNTTTRNNDVATLIALCPSSNSNGVTQPISTLPSTPPTDFFPLGSGGYADHIFRYAARELYGIVVDVVPWQPAVVTGQQVAGARQQQQQQQAIQTSARVAASAQRRRDFYEAILYRLADGSYSYSCDKTQESNEVVLRFAISYGMQTIQRVLQPFQGLQTEKTLTDSPYDYIEAMACPSGCVNGGGQNRLAERETPTETRERVARTLELFSANRDSQSVAPVESTQLVTSYHVVPPLELSMGAAAGVAVKDIQW